MNTIYAAGHYVKNLDIGGWTTIIKQENKETVTLSGSKQNTDSDEIILTAIIEGLTRISKPSKIHVYAHHLDCVHYTPLSFSAQDEASKAHIDPRLRKNSTLLLGDSRRVDLWEQIEESSGLHEVCWFGPPIGLRHSEYRFADLLARREISLADDGKPWF